MLGGLLMRSRNRFFCSFLETCRKNLRTRCHCVSGNAQNAGCPRNAPARCVWRQCRRELLPFEQLPVHADDEGFLIIRAVEDPDATALRQPLLTAPEKIVIELLGGRRLKACTCSPAVDAGHHVLESRCPCRRRPSPGRSAARRTGPARTIAPAFRPARGPSSSASFARTYRRNPTARCHPGKILETELAAAGDTVRFRELLRLADNSFEVHKRHSGNARDRNGNAARVSSG